FLGALIKGAIHGGRFIHGMIQNHH
nr:Chain A, Pleurocidin-like peptide WF3 [Pseudopleuronectes americanus]